MTATHTIRKLTAATFAAAALAFFAQTPGVADAAQEMRWDNVKQAQFEGSAVDGDSDVDGRDYLVWQRGGSPAESDDYNQWRTNFGAGASTGDGGGNTSQHELGHTVTFYQEFDRPATDGDGDVDGRDFLVWQRSGSPAPLSAGDLADWQDSYGTSGY